MPRNMDQFAIYSGKILAELHDSFPIPKYLDGNKISSEYAIFRHSDELNETDTKREFFTILEQVGNETQKQDAKNTLPNLNERADQLRKEKTEAYALQKAIFDGTLDFLVSENIIRESESGKYLLTSKGFSHLNKSFKSGAIADDETTGSIIKKLLQKGSDTTFQGVAGALSNVMTQVVMSG